MALVKYGGGLVGMSGSIAGTTFARNAVSSYARARTKPINPSSALQVARRTAMSYMAEYWHETLTPIQRTGWATYANALSMKNRLGELIKLSGFNHFMRVNTFRYAIAQPITPAPPTALSLPDKDPTFTIAASAGSQLISVSYDITLPWKDVAGSAMGVFMGRPQIVTRNFFKGPWQFGYAIATPFTTPKTFTAPMLLVLGQRIWCYARISTGALDSRLSEQFSDDCIVAA